MTTTITLPVSTDIFDSTCEGLLGTDVRAAIGQLRACLRHLRASLSPAEWRATCDRARRHRVHDLLLESPFTHRAYTKPHGFAGDAGLMDLIYGSTAPPADLSPLGAMLYAYEFDSPCFHSVRTRRAVLAREIDAVAPGRPDATVLSIACGHLREVEWSRAARQGVVSITALDQDPESVTFVRQQYGAYPVTALRGSVADLLRRTLRFQDVDLAYAAGLYDYLDDDVAMTLTAALFRLLGSNGRLLIANFTPATHDAAFMEAIMDWHLVYRTAEDMVRLTARIPGRDIAAIEQFSDDNGHITYLRVVKA
jgi:hypothetical protein